MEWAQRQHVLLPEPPNHSQVLQGRQNWVKWSYNLLLPLQGKNIKKTETKKQTKGNNAGPTKDEGRGRKSLNIEYGHAKPVFSLLQLEGYDQCVLAQQALEVKGFSLRQIQ